MSDYTEEALMKLESIKVSGDKGIIYNYEAGIILDYIKGLERQNKYLQINYNDTLKCLIRDKRKELLKELDRVDSKFIDCVMNQEYIMKLENQLELLNELESKEE